MHNFVEDHRESGKYEAEKIRIGDNILAMGLIAWGGESLRTADNTMMIDSFIPDWYFPENTNQHHPIDSGCAEKAFVSPYPGII